MREPRPTTRALSAVVTAALVLLCAGRGTAQDASAQVAAPSQAAAATPAAAPAVEAASSQAPTAPAPVVSNLDFEGAGYLSLTFAELAVPDEGSLNPVGGGAYLTLRYVPATFPFHAFFESGGGMFATGSSSGPSGTDYDNRLSAWFFSPGVGFDLGPVRVAAGLGMALVMTRHFSDLEDTSSLALAVASNLGIAYRFFEKKTWATSVELRYQTIPGAKLNALSLGVRLRFASITYR